MLSIPVHRASKHIGIFRHDRSLINHKVCNVKLFHIRLLVTVAKNYLDLSGVRIIIRWEIRLSTFFQQEFVLAYTALHAL